MVQRHFALLTHEKGLDVELALDGALLTVAPLRLAAGVVLRRHNPVVQAVKSRLVGGATADPPPDGRGAVPAEQLQDQLPQEDQEGLPVACGL